MKIFHKATLIITILITGIASLVYFSPQSAKADPQTDFHSVTLDTSIGDYLNFGLSDSSLSLGALTPGSPVTGADGIVATAGILDRLFGNSIEKLYWKKVKESKLAVQSLVKRAEKLIAIVLSCLGRMGDARAKGNISPWIEELQRIGKSQSEFQIFARGIYDKHLKQLAEIVRANKPKPESAPSSTKTTMPEASKAEEAEELVEIPITEGEPIYENKPQVVAPKREPGRPTVDEAAKKREMEQIEQLENLLKNPVQPSVEPVAQPSVEPVVEQVVETPKIEEPVKPVELPKVETPKIETPKVETPKVETPKAETPKPKVELPKVNVSRPTSVPVPSAPAKSVETPKAVSNPASEPATENVAVRGRGRPRKYPVGQSPTDIKKREREERKNQLSQFVNPEAVKAPVETAVPETLTTPFEAVAPVIPNVTKAPAQAPKPNASKILNRLKNELTPPSDEDGEKIDLHKPTIEKPPENSDKKITMVLLPKIKPDNLDRIQERLEKELGHPVKFVTRDTGREIAKEYHDAGWNIDGMEYSEVQAIEEKFKKNPLEMLDDQEFLNSLPRLSNGFFDKGKILNNDVQIQGGKAVEYESKYPEFQNLDEKTRKAVIDKINKLQENPDNLIIPVKKEKKTKDDSTEKTVQETVKSEPKVEPKSTKPEIEKKPTLEEEIASIPSDEEDDMKVYEHGDFLEKLLNKSVSKMTEIDVRQLLSNNKYVQPYLDSLPKMKNNKFDMNLIRKFPEIKILEEENPRFLKQFLKDIESSVNFGNSSNKWKEQKSKSANAEEAVIKYSHRKFFNELEKVANAEDYGLMAAMMCAYSEEIEKYDLETSIKLIQAAEKLI